MPSTPAATIVITTRNRAEDLRRALASCLAQGPEFETLVIDDASTDGTPEVLEREFPSVRRVRHEVATGYIVGRNEAAGLARGEVIVSIDDDAEFSAPGVVGETLKEFSHPRVGVVAIPYADVNRSPEVHQRARGSGGIEVLPHFIGTAHALRRDLFLRLGGYWPVLRHQGEEMDYAVRLLAAGYVVRAGSASPIWHYESPRRDMTRLHHQGRRNDILYALRNVPAVALPWHLAATTAAGLRLGVRGGFLGHAAWGLWLGFRDARAGLRDRKAVPMGAYRLMRRLRGHPGTPLAEIEPLLPPLAE